MDINLFSKHFYPENFFINNIIKKLTHKKGLNFTIITGYPYYNYKKSLKEKNLITFYRSKVLRVFSYIPKKKNFFSIFLNYFSYILFLYFKILKLIFKKSDCNLIFATSPLYQALPVILLSKFQNKPISIWVQDLWPEVLLDHGYKNKILLKLLFKISRYVYISCDQIMVQSYEFKSHLEKNYNLQNIMVLYNPSPFRFLIKNFKTKKNKIFKFAYAGNIGKSQNLIEVCKKLKNIKLDFLFYIIGSGSELKILKQYIFNNNLSNKIIIQDYMDEIALINYLQKMNGLFITLNEGISLSKTLPGKLSMYLSFGVPILSFAPGAVNSFIKKNKIGIAIDTLDNFEIKFIKYLEKSSIFEKNYYCKIKNLFEKYFDVNKTANILEKNLLKLKKKV